MRVKPRGVAVALQRLGINLLLIELVVLPRLLCLNTQSVSAKLW